MVYVFRCILSKNHSKITKKFNEEHSQVFDNKTKRTILKVYFLQMKHRIKVFCKQSYVRLGKDNQPTPLLQFLVV